MKLFQSGIIAVCVLGAAAFAQVECRAQLIAGDNFAVLAQSNGAVLLSGGAAIGPTGLVGTYIVGDVGMGTGGLFLADNATLDGNLTFVDSQAKVTADSNYDVTASFHVVGSVNYGNPGFSVTNALSAAEKDSTIIGGYAATQTFGGISLQSGQTQTITGVSGANVININGDLNISSGKLFFVGPADAIFYVNVSGQVSINGGIVETLNGKQVLVGVESTHPGNVVFNMTGANELFDISGNSLVEGSVLNVNGSSEFAMFDSALEGQVVSNTIDLSDSQVLTPEGSSLTMFMLGLLPIMFIVNRRRSQAHTSA